MPNDTLDIQIPAELIRDDANNSDLEALYNMIVKVQKQISGVEDELDVLQDFMDASFRYTAVVIDKVKNPADLVIYGPYSLIVAIPELGDDSDSGRIAKAQRTDSGRIIIPKSGTLINVYKDKGTEGLLYWNGIAPVDLQLDLAYQSLKEERATEHAILALVPVADIDIFESNADFKFLLDRTIPALHKLVLQVSSGLSEIEISTGISGTIKIGLDEIGVNLDFSVGAGGSIIMATGALGDIELDSGVGGDILIDSGKDLFLSALAPGRVLINTGVTPAVKGTEIMAYLTSLVTWLSTHMHPTAAVGPPSPPAVPPTPPDPSLISLTVFLE